MTLALLDYEVETFEYGSSINLEVQVLYFEHA
jgi:hypothetical protein